MKYDGRQAENQSEKFAASLRPQDEPRKSSTSAADSWRRASLRPIETSSTSRGAL